MSDVLRGKKSYVKSLNYVKTNFDFYKLAFPIKFVLYFFTSEQHNRSCSVTKCHSDQMCDVARTIERSA